MSRKLLPADDELMQALRNITREYMRLSVLVGCTTPKDTVCVVAALAQLAKHDFKPDNPL